MQKFGEAIAGLLGALLGLAALLVSAAFFGGVMTGVTREHCLDIDASNATRTVEVDSHWTYILWPPLLFSSIDPNGRCVRNTPLRVGLHQVGIWKLPSPEEQVREHVRKQLEQSAVDR